jgi:hypothetical protein
MELAVTSIQRNRAPWLKEWLAFHLAVGVQRFYLYAHACTDDTLPMLMKLARHWPLVVHDVPPDTPQPQLAAYRHAWASYGAQVGWMAFIDGDEFLFPTRTETLGEALAPFTALPISAVGVHWVCYGSSGHLMEPAGLVLENYTRHSGPEFLANRHVKSIVRGGEPDVVPSGSHVFQTPRGTVDDSGRPVTGGLMLERPPSYEALRINHYLTQSWQYFTEFKQRSGAADLSPDVVRPEAWFKSHDRNECDDGTRWRFLLAVKRKLQEIDQVLERS